MQDLTQIVRDYVAVWNEADRDERRRRIEAVWTPNGTSCYRLLDAQGYDAIEARVSGSFDKWLRDGKYVFRSKSSVCHHQIVKSEWEMVTVGNGVVEANGVSFLVVTDEGQIRDDYQFNPSLNDGGELAELHHAAMVERDAAPRRRLVEQLWALNGIFLTAAGRSTGHREIDAAIDTIQNASAAQGLVLSLATRSQAHHHVAWLQSPLRAEDGRTVANVSHLLIRGEDSRSRCDCMFEENAR